MASILEVHNVKVYGSGEKVVFLSHGFGTGRFNGMLSAASVLLFAGLEAVRLPHTLEILIPAWKRSSGNYKMLGRAISYHYNQLNGAVITPHYIQGALKLK
jgi:hypothetical protein